MKGPWRGAYFDLYVMLDIFSRKAMRWEVHTTENADLARAFIENAIIGNGGVAPRAIHADRGTSMTSKPVAALLDDLHISQSHSRPHVSNDNPYSEAQFKTLKYCPVFPGQFGSIHDARAFSEPFFDYYNNHHRHSSNSASIHARACLRRHRDNHPGAPTASPRRRLRRQPPPLPRTPPPGPNSARQVWINQPRAIIETQEAPQTTQVA